MNKSSKSTARLETRVDAEIKARWQQAADIKGISLTDFVIASLTESADKAIAQHQAMKLTSEDTRAFVNALLDPPLPNEKLSSAVSEYRRKMGG